MIRSIYSCSLFINSHCDYISIDMSEAHILIHIMLDDVAVKKCQGKRKITTLFITLRRENFTSVNIFDTIDSD